MYYIKYYIILNNGKYATFRNSDPNYEKNGCDISSPSTPPPLLLEDTIVLAAKQPLTKSTDTESLPHIS